MNTNEFAKATLLVDTVLKKYREVRKTCGIADDAWHSRSIERMAKPFIKGYFTLAVVGKVPVNPRLLMLFWGARICSRQDMIKQHAE